MWLAEPASMVRDALLDKAQDQMDGVQRAIAREAGDGCSEAGKWGSLLVDAGVDALA
jgi:hypothetical protein